MKRSANKKLALIALAVSVAFAVLLTPAPPIVASDHADAPINSNDQGIDQGDTYAFLDPNDNSKVVLGLTVRGFIVPAEAVNFAFFDPGVRYVFEIETTGDARPDQTVLITFSPRTGPTTPQTATIILPFGEILAAPTTLPTLAGTPNAPVVTTDLATGISFFAGETDDPFFFDIPGFSRFRASVLAGAPDATTLQRGRDSFAGYNILSIVLRIPVSYFRLQFTAGNPGANVIGVDSLTQRRRRQFLSRTGGISGEGGFQTLDRSGNPALNALIIPFARKDEYNASTTFDDANGKFAADIVATLQALGTNATNIGILASVFVTRGDMLRLNTSVANSGPGGGNNAGAGFPNGRRPVDDVVDTFLFLATNGGITTGDNANTNDVAFRDTFPFLAAPQQPRASGTDDNTRN
ncbi:MAG TPA: DUF4331 family protein [Blastocatellia bacterium]|nr:DUF4331 family protein [Blastocatellia bacterium]